jgi:Na+-driven multidrug efflux pump
MLSSFMLNLGFYLINTETQKYGPIVLNGQGIANNITAVCFNLPGAFSSAVTTMVSMNVGAGVPDKARRSCVAGCFISAITAVVVIAIVVPLSPLLTILFTRQAEVLEIANRALHIYTYSVVGFGLCMTVQGAFIGLGRTKVPLVLGILRIWLLRYLFILATERALSYYAIFWGNLFSNYSAALLAIFLLSRVKWVSVIGTRKAEERVEREAVEA